MDATSLQNTAERTVALMRAQGFDAALASASVQKQDELNIAADEPSLLRSTERSKLSLVGLVDGRRAATELGDLSDDGIRRSVAALFDSARSAPQDAANAISGGQHARIEQGPQQSDGALLARCVRELLAFRHAESPKTGIEEAAAAHTLLQSRTLTSGGTDLACSLGWYSLGAMCTARDGQAASSFNFTGGSTDDLGARPAAEHFGIGEMLRDTERQIHTQPIAGKFDGDVVLAPGAVADLLGWLQGQLSDASLIDGSSLYRERVGQAIASPLLSLRSRFDAPGIAALSADAFATPPVEVLRAGTLLTLTPSLYGSRKTGLKHVPVAGSGWEIDAGATPLAEMIAGVRRGALVGRLSMGNPASNGDFSSVIKNSFLIDGGALGAALSETMIAGNMARLLRDVNAVSAERIDTGTLRLPWLRIGGLHFS